MSEEIPALLYIEKAMIEQKKRLQHERMRHKKALSSLARIHTPHTHTHTEAFHINRESRRIFGQQRILYCVTSNKKEKILRRCFLLTFVRNCQQGLLSCFTRKVSTKDRRHAPTLSMSTENHALLYIAKGKERTHWLEASSNWNKTLPTNRRNLAFSVAPNTRHKQDVLQQDTTVQFLRRPPMLNVWSEYYGECTKEKLNHRYKYQAAYYLRATPV